MEAFFERPRNFWPTDLDYQRIAEIIIKNNKDIFKPLLSLETSEELQGAMNNIKKYSNDYIIDYIMNNITTPIHSYYKQKTDSGAYTLRQLNDMKEECVNKITTGLCTPESQRGWFNSFFEQCYKPLKPNRGDGRKELLDGILCAIKLTELTCTYGIRPDVLNNALIKISGIEEQLFEKFARVDLLERTQRKKIIEERNLLNFVSVPASLKTKKTIKEKIKEKREKNLLKFVSVPAKPVPYTSAQIQANLDSVFNPATASLQTKEKDNRKEKIKEKIKERREKKREKNLLKFVSVPAKPVPYTSAQIQANLDSVFNPAAGGQSGGRRRRHSTRKHKKRVHRTRRRHV